MHFECWLVVCAANGYVRSDGIVALYLQKKEVANRIYANLVYSNTNTDGYKERGI